MRRHDLATLRPDSPVTFCGPSLDSAATERVYQWIREGLPLVVARQNAAEPRVLLGLTLPPGDGKHRVSCLVEPVHLHEVREPLSIHACLKNLPSETAEPLQALGGELNAMGVKSGVYGSLSWETLSGMPYRRAESDIDLICDVTAIEQLPRLVAALRAADAKLPCRLDGEIRFPNGAAVAWMELANAIPSPASEVLIKEPSSVRLGRASELLLTLRSIPHAG